ncbi:MAG: agmatine deiminase family protein, partial [Bacteroidia bacterium]
MPAYLQSRSLSLSNATNARGILSPPPFSGIRAMAEWEELQTLCITWTSFTSILREIVRNARLETTVTIVCSDSTTVKNYLSAGAVPLSNIRYLIAPFNTIWMRDYGVNPVYANNVDSLFLVDWIYNRPRPKDDTVGYSLSQFLNVPLFETAQAPYNLIHTGGNYMSDGFGTAFSSFLTDNENPGLSASQIDTIMKKFMGINRYIRFPTLPNDGIHHIDMHMKLLDEETLLVGKYPTGISDGPQIEANLSYITSNFNSVYGTPYKVVRIPQPPDKNNLYPSQGGDYLTYSNAVFVNKTVILPLYYTKYDTTALRVWKESLPGYKIVGIDCDQTAANIIAQSGAIHCITQSVGVADPLLISHGALPNTCDTVNAFAIGCDCDVVIYSPTTGSNRMKPNVFKTYTLEEFSSYHV